MTPAEFEWAQEQIEMAYERGQIGRIAFIRRMMKLGFRRPGLLLLLDELDAKRNVKGS